MKIGENQSKIGLSRELEAKTILPPIWFIKPQERKREKLGQNLLQL